MPKNFTINQLEDIDRRYQDYKILEEIYDYTDMLVMAKYAELDLPDLDYLFVDEAQDLSALQWILVDRLAERTDKIVIAGDDKQCQPPGSKVLTTEGFKNIEDLDEETDKLISYDKRGAQCYGKYSFKKKAHEYTGLLHTLKTEKGKTTVTEGHINLVKWNNKDTSKNVVYLMQRGDYFRIGWCQLFSSGGFLHLGERSRKEKDEKTWILRVCDSKKEASIYESIIAAKYGLSLVPFEPVNGSTYYDRDGLDHIFKSIPDQKLRAGRLLKDFGKELSDPFLQEGKRNRHGATIFECSTRNLIEGLMSLPHRVTNKKIEWKQIQSITVKEYSGVVYGLDVEKHHTYITDANIITHNCINEFAGADVDTFLALPGKVETLKQSYRIPSAVFNLANTIMKRMLKYRKEGANWTPREEKGKVITCTSLPLSNILSGEWLLLARSSYQLEPMRERLIRLCSDFPFLFTVNGVPPVDMDIFRVIELHKLCALKKRSILELVTVADTDNLSDKKTKFDYIKLFKKFMSSDPALKPWEIDSNFKEKLLLPWYKAMDKLDRYTIKYVEHLYNVYKEKKEDLFEDAKIRLMTIHAAKGREADNVLVCMDLPRSARASMLQADDDTEAKVLYVAITRAKKNLYLYSTNNNRYGSLKTYLE